jgi:hypothetical protein
MQMEAILLAVDSVYGLIFLAVGVLAALQSHRDLTIAKKLVVVGVVLMVVRWSIWAVTTEFGWATRGTVGALLGAALFVLVPAALHWLEEKRIATAPSVANSQANYELPVIAVNCHPAPLPTVVPPNGFNYVDFRYSPGGGGQLGVAGGGTPGSKLAWPFDRIVMPMYCEFTIHDNIELYDVVFILNVVYHDVAKNSEGQIGNGPLVGQQDFPIAIGRINNNYSFGFYAFTAGDHMVYVTFPETAKYADGRGDKPKEAKLLTINWRALSFAPAAAMSGK